MPVFLPANKRKSKGIMRECAGLGLVGVAAVAVSAQIL